MINRKKICRKSITLFTQVNFKYFVPFKDFVKNNFYTEYLYDKLLLKMQKFSNGSFLYILPLKVYLNACNQTENRCLDEQDC